MTASQKKKAEKIYRVMFTQDFADFYGEVSIDDMAPFSRHITADENCPTKNDILEEIVELFNL